MLGLTTHRPRNGICDYQVQTLSVKEEMVDPNTRAVRSWRVRWRDVT